MAKKPVRSAEAENEFYEWVGRSIKQWAKIEFWLHSICAMAISSKYRGVPQVIYWRQPSVSTRLTLISDLLDMRLIPINKRPKLKTPQQRKNASPELAKWSELVTKLDKSLLPFRNFIAHQPAWHRFKVDTSEDGVEFVEFWHTTQNLHDKERRPSSIGEPGVADMKAHCAELDLFVEDLKELAERLEPLLVPRTSKNPDK